MSAPTFPRSHPLSVSLSGTLEEALRRHCRTTGETPAHVVQAALAAFLDVEHHTLFQVSTSGALVQGVYQGCVTVGKIKDHGDFGLGTFDSLDGEGVLLDGRVWHARADGSVVEAADGDTAPFWVATSFEAERTATLAAVSDWKDLCAQLDGLRLSSNLFVAVRIDGVFDQVTYRVASRAAPGEGLVAATGHQAEFSVRDVQGVLLGFWSPTYAGAFNVPGYHLHFLSRDHKSGGHVLGVRARGLLAQVMDASNLSVALPESESFLKADLSEDPAAALRKAETRS